MVAQPNSILYCRNDFMADNHHIRRCNNMIY